MLLPLMSTLAGQIDRAFHLFDQLFFRLMGSLQSAGMTAFAKGVTFFGDSKWVALVLAAAVVLLLFRKTRKAGLCLLGALLMSTLLTNGLLKPLIARPRPYVALQGHADYMAWYTGVGAPVESDYAFPSGHTTAAFSYCTALFLLLREKKKKIAWLLPLLAVLVGLSRIYLMVHYASDVLFGMLIGTLCATAAYLLSTPLLAAIDKTPLARIDLGKRLKKQ